MENMPLTPASGEEKQRSPWGLHALVLLVLVGLPMGGFALRLTGSHRIGDTLAFAFVFVPLSIAYVLLSSVLVLVIDRGFRDRPGLRGWRCVAAAHAVGLVGGALTTLLFIRMG